MGSHVALVKGNLHMGFQVDRVTHILWFWLKDVARWDLRIMEKREREREKDKKKKKVLYKAYYAKH